MTLNFQKDPKKILLAVLLVFGVFVLIYLYNLYKYRQILTESHEYIESVLTVLTPTSPKHTTKVGEPVQFAWEISAPVDRVAQRTFVLYGSDSSPSATLYESDPQKLPYPIRTDDYSLGNFHLPDKFSTTVHFDSPGMIYYRFYARVDGRDLYSPEYSIQVHN